MDVRAPYQPQPYDSGGEAKEETVVCPNCGKHDAPDAKFCDQCGFKLEGAEGVTSLKRFFDRIERRDWAKWDAERKSGLVKSLRLSAAQAISRPSGHAHPTKPGQEMSVTDVMHHAKGLEHAANMIEQGFSPSEVEKAASNVGEGAHGDAMRGAAAAMREAGAPDLPKATKDRLISNAGRPADSESGPVVGHLDASGNIVWHKRPSRK